MPENHHLQLVIDATRKQAFNTKRIEFCATNGHLIRKYFTPAKIYCGYIICLCKIGLT